MKKGMNVWSLPNNLTLEEQFILCRQAGFDTIELNITEEKSNNNIVKDELSLQEKLDLTLDVTINDLNQIKKLSQVYDLPISSISTSLHWNYRLNDINEQIRNKGIDIIKKMIDVCQFLEGDTVLIVPGVIKSKDDYEQSYARSLEAFQQVAPYAEERNILIGIENVWNRFLLSPIEMKQFIDEVDSSNVGAYFDVGNIMQYGFPEQWISVLNQRIVKVHVKDYNQKIGNIRGFTQLLQGDVNWYEVIQALQKINYRGPLTCELTPYTTNGKQLAFDSSQALNYIISLKEDGGIKNG